MSAVTNNAAGQDARTDGNISLRNLHANLALLAEELAEAVKRFDSALQVGTFGPSTLEAMSPREYFVSLLELRQARDRYFSHRFFDDPVWDIMLELMIARIDDRNILASELSKKLNPASENPADLL
ncbi:MAG TPA: hypothetical protein VLA37_06885, partial [Sphingomonadaceae bacterium]|nr:hypothetical protein [Sphingomonadaceae bacterium]